MRSEKHSSGQPTVCQECGGGGAGGLHEDDCSQNSSSQPTASACVGCEGQPAPGNNPCGVCGKTAASAEPAPAVNRETVIEWLDALDIEVTDRQLDGLFHAVHFAAPVASAEPGFNGWYCAHCQRGVDSSEVTYHEQHQECGRVITDDRPPAPVAQEPVARVNDDGFIVETGLSLSPGTKLYAAPVAAQAQLSGNLGDLPDPVQRLLGYAGKTMREARNPHLTAREAIVVGNWLAAQLHPSLQPDTQRAEQRGAESIQDREDAERYRFAAKHCILSGGVSKFGWPIAPMGKSEWDRYIDAARAKGPDHD